ncbi:uncharacterized protein KD926_002861 [Aspergillus affinis]|uniref:uncharacterized protein n=1 Tax=Aspergillus affinis TaxID=1070780 RepID=UPI0022FE0091|nr:uncharacterized protein KD926_002861 [Aspergillus affinis]KAI9035832.1 hypothetical protein KD926_002861 [Aspergillus affinis]
MLRNLVRERVDELWKKVFMTKEIAYSEDPSTMNEKYDEELAHHNITRVSFDLDAAEVGTMPCFLFKPPQLSEIREHQPSDGNSMGPLRKEPILAESDINLLSSPHQPLFPPTFSVPRNKRTCDFIDGLWRDIVVDRNIEISQETEVSPPELVSNGFSFILMDLESLDTPEGRSTSWTLHGVRPSLPSRFRSLATFSGLKQIHLPNPFLLSSGLDGDLPGNGTYTTRTIFEATCKNGHPTQPHVTMMTSQDVNGRENAVLYGELASIISAMRNQVFQPKVKEHEQEAFFEGEPFASFETFADAPNELFAHFWMSKPEEPEKLVLRSMSKNIVKSAAPYRPPPPQERQVGDVGNRRRMTFPTDHQDSETVICPYCERKGHIEITCHWKRLDTFLMGAPCYTERSSQQKPQSNRGKGNCARQRVARAQRRRRNLENCGNHQQQRPEGGSERRARNRNRQRQRRRYYHANPQLGSLPASTIQWNERHRVSRAAYRAAENGEGQGQGQRNIADAAAPSASSPPQGHQPGDDGSPSCHHDGDGTNPPTAHQDSEAIVCAYCEREGHLEISCLWKQYDEFIRSQPRYAERLLSRPQERQQAQHPRGRSEQWLARRRERQAERRRAHRANPELAFLPPSTAIMNERRRAALAARRVENEQREGEGEGEGQGQ